MTNIKQIWARSQSGVLVPVGTESESSSLSRTDPLGTRKRAKLIEEIFSEAGVRLPAESDLGRMIQTAKNLWENWFLDDKESLTPKTLFLSMHLERIADAILPLRHVNARAEYLQKLLSGTLNFSKKEPSKAKDVLWELEVWSRLVRRNAEARLVDPPDVVVDYEHCSIGIACKKIYSERHVQNVLSQAVNQIERKLDFGIVAINLDELFSGDVVLKMETSQAVSDRLHAINMQFLARHKRHFRKYLSKGQLISALVANSIITDVPTERPRFRNTFQWTVWTIPGLDERHLVPLQNFYGTVMKKPENAEHITSART